MRPAISVLIPARNEKSRLAATILSIARARASDRRVEFVVVDDCSEDGTVANLVSAAPRLLREKNVDIVISSLEQHEGNYRARNRAAELATSDVLFITDAHVQFSKGWDEEALQNIRPGRILAGTVTQPGTRFHGYGCKLLIPFMGTKWNEGEHARGAPVPIATCSATVLHRDLFFDIGAYDTGMIVYGGGEPEFSVRAWLHGAEIVSCSGIEVMHEFKASDERGKYMKSIQPAWVHNCLRFGLLYLTEAGCMQMLRFYARLFPAVFQTALNMLEESNVWERRAELEGRHKKSFDWFVQYFDMKNQIGGAII